MESDIENAQKGGTDQVSTTPCSSKQNVPPLEYYKILATFRSELDTSFWTSVNFFILVQSIFVAGVFGFLSRDDQPDSVWLMPIELIGLIIAIMWLFVSNRKKMALRIVEWQARLLEDRICIKDEKGTREEDYSSFFFHGSRAIFHTNKLKSYRQEGIQQEPIDKNDAAIRKAFYPTIHDRPLIQWLGMRFSSIDILTLWVPSLFILLWAGALFITVSWFIEVHSTIEPLILISVYIIVLSIILAFLAYIRTRAKKWIDANMNKRM